MLQLPIYVYLTFAATVLLAIGFFYQATKQSTPFMVVLLIWIGVQSLLALTGFYTNPPTLTIRFPLLIGPPLLFLLSGFLTKKGRAFLDELDLPTLTLFHVIRIPVELVLFWLFVGQHVPEAMTFHGRNVDIFSGLSAPIVYYFGFVKKLLSPQAIVVWNLVCLALLLNVVSTALLSLPARYIRFGFEQPNLALGYFPFVLLPSVLVPLVLLATSAAVRQLLKKRGVSF
jgi:hypothetical protein